jgi:rubrerythrin
MIVIDKLNELEKASLRIIKDEEKHLETVRMIRELFGKIDFSSEQVPVSSKEKLIEILYYLKGEPLTVDEIITLGKVVEDA